MSQATAMRRGFVLIGLYCWLSCCWQAAVGELVQYLEVLENAPPGTRVGFIEADSPPYLVVPVPGSRADSDLQVEPGSGEIRTRAVLDRENRDSYSMVALPQNVRVIVRVLDENDNVPSFPVDTLQLEFPENSPLDSKRALPPAKDPDLGRFSTQRYDIVAGNEEQAFRLVSQRGRDGVLYLDLQQARALDRETRASYRLLVEASDGGEPPLRSRLHVDVVVQDVNDNPPVWSRLRYTAELSENASVGTPVLQVEARDADSGDNGHIEYSINRRQSDRDGVFRIEPDSGLVLLSRPLDFESRQHHELVLVARDRGVRPLEASAFLSVCVTDVNDNQPIIALIFLSDDATPKVSEAAEPGELVARLSVSDPDSRAEYANASLNLNGGEGHFGLASRDGVIYLVVVAATRSLDRELCASYELVLEASDAGNPPLRASRSFRLAVTDVNDNAPHFERQCYEISLLENTEPGTSILRVHAHDPDEGPNARVRYALLNTTASFGLDSESGLLTNLARLDCEADPAPRLLIIAVDGGSPAFTATTTVQLIVHGLNNNEPIFERPFYNISLPEDLPAGRCFLKIDTRLVFMMKISC
ncbi:protein dachsous-like [Phymastichus coffea]|uniref:protein dachsous-like n=1 Tax=Phymastichus coffea TaxID=108790 RepID=UPI00273AA4DD|nr:protein dachsous-like [Phymastichus coffea]